MPFASPYALPAARASANIRPCRVIKYTTGSSTGVKVSEAVDASVVPLGITCEGVRNPPGTALDDGFVAILDEAVCYKGPGEMADALVGTGGVTTGAWVISDSAGAVILLGGVTQGFYVGQAQDTASAGDRVQVLVQPAPIGN